MRYEEKTKKAAKYSDEAGRQLQKTRMTQGAAVIACVASTITAACLTMIRSTTITSAIVALLNAAVCAGARTYVSGFWKGAARIPGAGDYNDAVRSTDQVITWLAPLGGAWIGLAGYIGVFGA